MTGGGVGTWCAGGPGAVGQGVQLGCAVRAGQSVEHAAELCLLDRVV